jgi:hypothetical protein
MCACWSHFVLLCCTRERGPFANSWPEVGCFLRAMFDIQVLLLLISIWVCKRCDMCTPL